MDGTEQGISQVASGENSPLSSSFSACNLLNKKELHIMHWNTGFVPLLYSYLIF